jgi:uncharacterized membrane protein YidH (DUF202 family)
MTSGAVRSPGERAGTAAQRTQLAWSRTTLTLAVAGLTMARLIWPHSNALGVLVLVVTLGVAVSLVGLTALHDRAIARAGAAGPDGVLLTVVALGTGVVGLAALVLIAVT